MIDAPEGMAVWRAVGGTLLGMWLPVLWGRYRALRASLPKPWRFGLVVGIGAHGATVLFGSLLTVPYDMLVMPHLGLDPYLDARSGEASVDTASLLLAYASVLFGNALLVVTTIAIPVFLTASWRRLHSA